MSQLARFQSAMGALEVDAVLVSSISHVQWLTGFCGSFGFVIVQPNQAVFITDSRYTIAAREQVTGMDVLSFGSPKKLDDVLAEQFAESKIQTIGFEPSISFEAWEQRKDTFSSVQWKSIGKFIPELLKIKSEDEVAKIQRACQLADACMIRALSMVQVGVTEAEIGLDIEFYFRKQGAAIGFEPIVASGPNSALPHARPSDRAIQVGDFVTIDLGCTLDGYSSDITRTVVVGKASDQHVEIYEQVLKAEETCCTMLVDGANGKDVDAKAREILDQKNLAQYFGHSLGHGLGRAVHDPGRLHMSADEPIRVGQVWTVEPGVYIEGFGGVRVEDDVYVSSEGPKILTHVPKQLTIV